MKFQKLTPNFSVGNVKETVKFYRDILGFNLKMAVPARSTNIENVIFDAEEYAYAVMSKDEVYVMFLRDINFTEDMPVLQGFPQGASVSFYIDVEGIEDVYKTLYGRLAIVKKLETTWYGMREFYIKDCNDYILGFAERE